VSLTSVENYWHSLPSIPMYIGINQLVGSGPPMGAEADDHR
jgi:hypothetical protein